MTYASVLTHVAEDDECAERLRLAIDLAAAFGSELIGIGAEAPELYLSPAGISWPRPGYRLADAGHEIAARLERLAGVFEATPGIDRVAHRWLARIADPAAFVSANARGADLIVASRPSRATSAREYALPAELALAAGRPVLVAPKGPCAPRFEKIMVGWKDTREARRALLDALPLLRRAANVIVAAVPEADDRRETETALEDVVRRLALLGVSADRALIDRAGQDAFAAFAGLVEREAPDLLVIGAYGHSRLRELVLGGFTHALMRDSRALIFSH